MHTIALGSLATIAAHPAGGAYRYLPDEDRWQPLKRIDSPGHRYGWLRVVIGDGHVNGRVYLGTSGRGIIVGEPAME